VNFRDYKWTRNPRGLHNKGVLYPFDEDRYTYPRMGWAKLVAGGNEFVPAAGRLADQNCMSIVRIFRENMGAIRPMSAWYENYKEYIAAGNYWFEFYNEPNLEGEWPQDSIGGPSILVSHENREQVIAPMMDNWIEWAENVIDIGGYPGFPALADTPDYRHATTLWLNAWLAYLKEKHAARFQRIIANGLWCATHPYITNHFYQEPPGGPAHIARPYYQQRASEGGWHFEYPYDPLQQKDDPGRTVFGGTLLTPYGDPNGLIATGQAFQELLKKYFDAGPVPVVGTEGGVWRVPLPDDAPHLIDTRYPAYDFNSYTEATMAMFRWIVEKGPPWFWGVTLWMETDFYDLQGTHPVIHRFAKEAPLLMNVANIDTGGGVFTQPVPKLPVEEVPETPVTTPIAPPGVGPGPVEGQPDYHWLILAPGLQADWFFQAARRYWQVFRPTVITDWSLIGVLPGDKSLAVTVLARSDTASYMEEHIRNTWPNVFYDPIVFDTLSDMQSELDMRATYQRRFG